MKIITDEVYLRQKCEPATFDEAKDITTKLIDTLSLRNEGDIGLAAPQIGILKQVCIIRAKDLVVLVNPRITETSGEVMYQEGCLSFPGSSVRTKRYEEVTVEAEYIGTAEMGGLNDNFKGYSDIVWEKDAKAFFVRNDNVPIENDTALLECVAVQHEIDHLNGILMFDRKSKPIKVVKKLKPNEKCPCGSGLKYKKCCGRIT